MSEGLLRQRRNLMITSILLWIMKYGGVTFTKFSFVGFDITLKNPNVLILSLWIAFAYFLFRYYQYFSDEGVKKLQSVFSGTIENKCEPIIRNLVKEKFPTNNDAIRYSYAFLKRDSWIYKGHALGSEFDPITGTNIGSGHFELPIKRSQLWKGIVFAMIDTIFRNSVVTDYLLPFAVACFVLYYCGVDDWRGSFLIFFGH